MVMSTSNELAFQGAGRGRMLDMFHVGVDIPNSIPLLQIMKEHAGYQETQVLRCKFYTMSIRALVLLAALSIVDLSHTCIYIRFKFNASEGIRT